MTTAVSLQSNPLRPQQQQDPASSGDAPAADPPASLGETAQDVGAALLDPQVWLDLLATLGRVALLFLAVVVAIRMVDLVTDRWTHRFDDLSASHPRRQRASTVSNLLSSAARYLLWPLALIIVLSEVGIDVAALVATAGIAGLAIGFGAQTLVQDVISGIFLLFDDTIHVGDTVDVGGKTGTVEYIGVRLIKVRRVNGELMMVPCGELRVFGNLSIDYARAIVNVELAYGQDTEAILEIMRGVAERWAAKNRDIITEGEEPVTQAITAMGESSVTARVMVSVQPGEQWPVERALRLRLKEAFEEAGVEIPFPRRVLYSRSGNGGNADRPERPRDPHAATRPAEEATD